jgi:hypothetical protein
MTDKRRPKFGSVLIEGNEGIGVGAKLVHLEGGVGEAVIRGNKTDDGATLGYIDEVQSLLHEQNVNVGPHKSRLRNPLGSDQKP